MHVVQLANFYTPTSGGLRTVLQQLGSEYVERGHQVTRIVPGRSDSAPDGEPDPSGVRTIEIASPLLKGSGGYRLIRRRSRVADLLERLAPDVIELSDKTTLVGATEAARARGTRVVLVSHERIDAILRPRPVASSATPDWPAWRTGSTGRSWVAATR